MSEINRTILFPKLVDSEMETGIITVNHNQIYEKEKIIKISLDIRELDYNNNKKETKKLKFYCDPATASNLNYKIKSSLNQIEEVIKYISKK